MTGCGAMHPEDFADNGVTQAADLIKARHGLL